MAILHRSNQSETCSGTWEMSLDLPILASLAAAFAAKFEA
eukprot:CAMPEP_0113711656 /NCGR_PEP_ID=MMETSP0038_2-20120614/30895_1 /TAXON_ID=2898 /ORGANISM="Cryptomonas paramecium" /LENGTH=39 /DNA_ID=CAMNT_0000637971 /DNA_START=128 /DNA_END=243 /DNA_ORIENTATION=- /assembly_acc=CAM_ASM_000170